MLIPTKSPCQRDVSTGSNPLTGARIVRCLTLYVGLLGGATSPKDITQSALRPDLFVPRRNYDIRTPPLRAECSSSELARLVALRTGGRTRTRVSRLKVES